eukprot:ANDGO_04701.mRNA.1 hypothetical protein
MADPKDNGLMIDALPTIHSPAHSAVHAFPAREPSEAQGGNSVGDFEPENDADDLQSLNVTLKSVCFGMITNLLRFSLNPWLLLACLVVEGIQTATLAFVLPLLNTSANQDGASVLFVIRTLGIAYLPSDILTVIFSLLLIVYAACFFVVFLSIRSALSAMRPNDALIKFTAFVVPVSMYVLFVPFLTLFGWGITSPLSFGSYLTSISSDATSIALLAVITVLLFFLSAFWSFSVFDQRKSLISGRIEALFFVSKFLMVLFEFMLGGLSTWIYLSFAVLSCVSAYLHMKKLPFFSFSANGIRIASVAFVAVSGVLFFFSSLGTSTNSLGWCIAAFVISIVCGLAMGVVFPVVYVRKIRESMFALPGYRYFVYFDSADANDADDLSSQDGLGGTSQDPEMAVPRKPTRNSYDNQLSLVQCKSPWFTASNVSIFERFYLKPQLKQIRHQLSQAPAEMSASLRTPRSGAPRRIHSELSVASSHESESADLAEVENLCMVDGLVKYVDFLHSSLVQKFPDSPDVLLAFGFHILGSRKHVNEIRGEPLHRISLVVREAARLCHGFRRRRLLRQHRLQF